MINVSGINHHFDGTDNINTYMVRCINSKMAAGQGRLHAISICHSEYKQKKQKKEMKKNANQVKAENKKKN